MDVSEKRRTSNLMNNNERVPSTSGRKKSVQASLIKCINSADEFSYMCGHIW